MFNGMVDKSKGFISGLGLKDTHYEEDIGEYEEYMRSLEQEEREDNNDGY